MVSREKNLLSSPQLVYLRLHLVVATLSGVGGSVLRVFDSLEGTIIHEKRLHHSQNGQLYSQRSLGVDLAFETQKATEDDQRARDLFVLTNGHTVHRMDGTVGELIWSWTAPEQTCVDDFIENSPWNDRPLGPWSYSNAWSSRIPRYTPSDSPNPTPPTPFTSRLSPQKRESS